MLDDGLTGLNDIGAQLERAELAVLSCTYRQQKLRLGMIGNRRKPEEPPPLPPPPPPQCSAETALPAPSQDAPSVLPQVDPRSPEEIAQSRCDDEACIAELEARCKAAAAKQQGRRDVIHTEERLACEAERRSVWQREKRMKRRQAEELLAFHMQGQEGSLASVGYYSSGDEGQGGAGAGSDACSSSGSAAEAEELARWSDRLESCLAKTGVLAEVMSEQARRGECHAEAVRALAAVVPDECAAREGLAAQREAEVGEMAAEREREGVALAAPTPNDLDLLESRCNSLLARLQGGGGV